MIADLRPRGVTPFTAAPPFFRLLWALGIPLPPPLFLGFLTLTLLMGTFFAVFWGALMWLIQWAEQFSLGVVIGVSAAAGLLFGLSMAVYYRRKAGQLKLPRWRSYPET